MLCNLKHPLANKIYHLVCRTSHSPAPLMQYVQGQRTWRTCTASPRKSSRFTTSSLKYECENKKQHLYTLDIYAAWLFSSNMRWWRLRDACKTENESEMPAGGLAVQHRIGTDKINKLFINNVVNNVCPASKAKHIIWMLLLLGTWATRYNILLSPGPTTDPNLRHACNLSEDLFHLRLTKKEFSVCLYKFNLM